ncbi:hypothetical protein ACWGQ9_05455 [Streptomyces parvus]
MIFRYNLLNAYVLDVTADNQIGPKSATGTPVSWLTGDVIAVARDQIGLAGGNIGG